MTNHFSHKNKQTEPSPRRAQSWSGTDSSSTLSTPVMTLWFLVVVVHALIQVLSDLIVGFQWIMDLWLVFTGFIVVFSGFMMVSNGLIGVWLLFVFDFQWMHCECLLFFFFLFFCSQSQGLPSQWRGLDGLVVFLQLLSAVLGGIPCDL